jgi:hypothetical protein
MDLKAFRRQSSSSKPAGLPRTLRAARVAFTKSGFTTMKLLKILAASLVALPVLVTLALIFRNPPVDRIAGLAEARALERVAHNGTSLGVGKEKKTLFDVIYAFCLAARKSWKLN